MPPLGDPPGRHAPATGAAAGVSLAAPEARRELFARLADPGEMRGLLEGELSRLAGAPVRVARCRPKVHRSRAALREGRIRVVYTLALEVGGERRELVALGTAPEDDSFLADPACRALRGHRSLAPFREAGLHVAELGLALRLYPFDPRLPGLAALEGPDAAERLARLAGCAERPARVAARELKQYKPFKRAVLRLELELGEPDERRAVYAKLFADGRGEALQREQSELFAAARGARALRLPEPLAYDAEWRALLAAEAPGGGGLVAWIKCVENGRDLPEGVDLPRVRRALATAALALAELQASGVSPRARRPYRAELARLERHRALLTGEVGRRHPALARDAAALLERLAALAPVADDLAPAHGGFRHKQTVGDERALHVIDWDGLCLAERTLDAATFLLRLRQEELRGGDAAAAMGALARGFRAEFLALVPRASPAALARDEALALLASFLRGFRRARKAAAAGLEHELAAMASAAREALARAEGRA